MESYKISTWGKIINEFLSTLGFGILILILLWLGKIAYLRYIVWLPILWLIYTYFFGFMYNWTVSFSVDDEGLIVKSILGTSVKIFWFEIEKIVPIKRKDKIKELRIFKKGKKRPILILEKSIINSKELFDSILQKSGIQCYRKNDG